jgi:hypothetical protein
VMVDLRWLDLLQRLADGGAAAGGLQGYWGGVAAMLAHLDACAGRAMHRRPTPIQQQLLRAGEAARYLCVGELCGKFWLMGQFVG